MCLALLPFVPDCAGVSCVTREHLAVALALGVPTFVALTKADLATGEEQLSDSLVDDIRQVLGHL